MLNEFYNYIANNTLNFFQGRAKSLRPGERYCLKLDNEEMVEGVNDALRDKTKLNNIQGHFEYNNVYSTFTIRLSEKLEVVVAAKVNGMTDDFLATLRNAELTAARFPILIVTNSTIDTITSGTADLAAKGMPFHADSIISKIKEDIQNAELNDAEKTLLEVELKRKQTDRYSDKSSLYEYSEILTVLGRGIVKDSDYPAFELLPDPDGKHLSDKKVLRNRLEENHTFFARIDQVFKHGNISENLSNEFDKALIKHLNDCKKKNEPWYVGYTYAMVKSSQDKLKKKLDNPLCISDNDFDIYSESILEYRFDIDTQVFIRNDGDTKAKSRNKNILIYNYDHKEEVTISIRTNIFIKPSWINCINCSASTSAREILLNIKPDGCTFASARISDVNNNINYLVKVCILDLSPIYFENLQTAYCLKVNKNKKRSKLQVLGITKELVINPGCNYCTVCDAINNNVYDCDYDQTLKLIISEDAIDTDTGLLDCDIKCGAVVIPLQIRDELAKPLELTGISAFKLKQKQQKSFEYREGKKIISGTAEFYANETFMTSLLMEKMFLDKDWLAMFDTVDGLEEMPLNISSDVRDAYSNFIDVLREHRTLPSLAYYKDDIRFAAEKYVHTVEEYFSQIPAGATLSVQDNDVLLLGCVIKNYEEHTIMMSPLHPLNVMYQLRLLEELNVGDVRDDLVEKLSALYLLPYIRNQEKVLYHAIEQKHSPEWRYYAPITNKRYQGTRNYVPKLVYEKITEYKKHFVFLFDDIGNSEMRVNLINMGDCREIFQGFIRYYVQSLNNDEEDTLLTFIINIYSSQSTYNEFSLLSDKYKLREYINSFLNSRETEDIDVNELIMNLSSNIHCFYHSTQENTFEYAHLSFFEMSSSEDSGASRMDTITTGISLDGLTSGTPSVLSGDWYKTGLGIKYARKNQLLRMATYYNALFRVAFSGSSYEPNSSIFTEIERGQEGLLGKIYSSSNWVVFIDPKVDLSFFQTKNSVDDELMIIHYSDQYTSASGYDDITVTEKSEQYNQIISEQLQKKGIDADQTKIHEIINLFNAVNGSWLLRLITAKKLSGAADSYFSREKMSILSAIKLCMAYYSHKDIVWIPISLEEMLRVSRAAGLSQNEGLLSAKNLGFDNGATSDDILLVGIEGPTDDLKVYLHPVEVKIGLNHSTVIAKAIKQVTNTYNGLWNSLWPEEGRQELERKLSRNFFMQVVLDCCEKMKLYNVYPDEDWDTVLTEYRENLLNENYVFSAAMDSFIGKGTVISFGTNVLNKTGDIFNDICLLEFPEKMGSEYMVLSAKEIEDELDADQKFMPGRLKNKYISSSSTVGKQEIAADATINDAVATCNNDSEHKQLNEGENNLDNSNQEDPHLEPEENKPANCEKDIDESDSFTGMNIYFGKDITTGEKVVWKPNDTNQMFHTNTGIIGTMGTGKTQFTKAMITQLYRDQKNNYSGNPLGILVFDYKGDYNESKEDFINMTNAKVVKPFHLPFNPLALTKSKGFKPLLPIHTANTFKDTLSKIYALGPVQRNTLFQCILDAYSAKGISPEDPSSWGICPPTFDMVYRIYSENEDIKKNDSLAVVMDKLYQFQVFESDPEKTVSLFEFLKGVVVVDLSGYDSDIQSLIVAITLDLFYSQMQASGSSKMNNQYRQLTKFILVDEADNFMSEGFPALKRILKEGREFGVGVILSTQFLKHFGTGDDDYSKYILTWVVHNVSDLKNSDVDFVFKTEQKSDESQRLYNDIKKLKKHHSIVKIGNNRPVYIKDYAFWQMYQDLNS